MLVRRMVKTLEKYKKLRLNFKAKILLYNLGMFSTSFKVGNKINILFVIYTLKLHKLNYLYILCLYIKILYLKTL